MLSTKERDEAIRRWHHSKKHLVQGAAGSVLALQQTNLEALRCTRLLEELAQKVTIMASALAGWERGLQTLQVDVGTLLQEQNVTDAA